METKFCECFSLAGADVPCGIEFGEYLIAERRRG